MFSSVGAESDDRVEILGIGLEEMRLTEYCRRTLFAHTDVEDTRSKTTVFVRCTETGVGRVCLEVERKKIIFYLSLTNIPYGSQRS